jgi:hypothetical protein
MKRIWTIFLLAGAAHAADVTLWITEQTIVDNWVRYGAMREVSRIFAEIGVSLEWAKAAPTPSDGIAIEVRYVKKWAGHPESMAFSTPFDPRAVITVLYDQILFRTERLKPGDRATVLGNALAHEIGHVLMGTNAHSSGGLMKAHWSASDFGRVIHRSLAFLPIDQDAIWNGVTSFGLERTRRLGSGTLNSQRRSAE